MPTYSNGTTHLITWQATAWAPGETRALPFFVPHSDLGLTLDSASPAPVGPILLSEAALTLTAGASQTLDIPYADRYALSVVSVSGSADVTLGSGDAVRVDTTADYCGTIPWRRCRTLTVTAVEDCVLRVVAERVG